MTEMIIGFFAGICIAMGLGGGCVFMIAALLMGSSGQLQAQGMNLLFFLAAGLVSLIIHQKNRMIRWRTALPVMMGGLLGGIVGAMSAPLLEEDLLRKIFAAFLLFMGAKEFFMKDDKKEQD